MNPLDTAVAELAARYRPLAVQILAEAIRVPSDFVDRSMDDGGDPDCGLSNHEGPRLEGLMKAIIEHDAVAHADDVGIDAFGNLVWTVSDPDDGIDAKDKKVIWYDGHSDTVKALRSQWLAKTDGALDSYDGLLSDSLDKSVVRDSLGYVPDDDAEWEHLVFGRGSADQLSGVVSEIIATKIMLELRHLGALRGVIVKAIATVAEEDNDGGGPMHITATEWPDAGPEGIPDVVVLTEGTGDAQKGALGIYRGQRGRMQIEVTVTGRSSHGSMPWEGLNPLEFGSAIISEAARAYDKRDGFLDDSFLGHGTRTASVGTIESPSDCAVPERFVFRFDRRLTIGETPEQAVADVERLEAVATARAAGLTVDIAVPHYTTPTWTGTLPHNEAIYPGWVTPEDHPAIVAAVSAYERVVGPHVAAGGTKGELRKDVRVDRWIFSTDGVGFPIRTDNASVTVPTTKNWVVAGQYKHPAMFGFGPGIEQNTHKIGECVDARELQHAIALHARFPSLYVEQTS